MGAFRVLLRSSRARIAEHYATKHQSGYSCSTRNLKEGIRSFKSQRTSPSSKHTQLPSERKVQGFFTRSRLADGFREPRSCYFLENQLFSSRFHSSSASVPQGIEEISDDLPNSDNLKEPHGGIDVALNAVVKVFTVSSSPSYFLPWQNKPQREVSGSGFILSDRRILTNAHVVADHSYVLVRKHGSPTKFRAKVEAIGHECDLALLRVEDEEFWDGMQALELGEIPFLQDSVAAVGYPQGGDNICVTRGVVSRVEPVQYIHGATHLIAIQIDAAINPGNSGGPAMIDNTVVGVVFQNLCNAENIGYIIPVPVIKHFLADVQERGRYVGFCSLGLVCQATENKQIREHLQMDPEMTGVLVSKVHPLTEVSRYIEKDDVLLSFDGISIANDGSVHFRNRERISFLHYVTMKREGETGVLRVLRKGKELEFSIKLAPVQPLVPNHQFDRLPSYYIFAGLVFVPLTQPYLHEFGEDWYNVSPRRLCDRAFTEMPKKPGEQYVIMSQVLMDDINAGYERLAELQVLKVNGVEIVNLQHLRQLVEGCKEKYLRFDLDDGRVIVLNYEAAQEASVHILKHHRISSSMSADLLQAESEPEKCEDVERKIGVACSAD